VDNLTIVRARYVATIAVQLSRLYYLFSQALAIVTKITASTPGNGR
jgi:hypothetical protein